MKTLFISFIIIICVIQCNAQKKLSAGILSINGAPFKIEQSGNLFFVTDINHFKKFKTYIRVDDIQFSDPNVVINCLLKVFNINRIKQLLPELRIGFTFGFDHTGKVYSVQYFMSPNTTITVDEIGVLDKLLKNTVVFLVPQNIKDDNIASFTIVTKFQKLLEKAQIN